MPQAIIKLINATFRRLQYITFADTNLEILPEQNWAITGVNGSGKTTLLQIIEGKLLKIKGQREYSIDEKHDIASVYFSDSSINYSDYYYQQRYNSGETEGIITVRDFLKAEKDSKILNDLNIPPLLNLEIIKLSNGQVKKMLIAKALLKNPRVLLLDNLFTGLDKNARKYINNTLDEITQNGTQIIIALENDNIPECITNVTVINNFSIVKSVSKEKYTGNKINRATPEIPPLPDIPETSVKTIAEFVNVNIQYGSKHILDNINWHIKTNDKWALVGPNGAGKSMLLSLIFADNPQAYKNHIILFDRRRGTGESIWDIKEKIGFVSPEMHLYFTSQKTCFDIALGGIYDNPYKKAVITNQNETIKNLFNYFSISPLINEVFTSASTSQQNIVLLIRAIIKNPLLLVLDEPFQGMDLHTIELAKKLLDVFCRNRTLIFVSHQPDEIPDTVNKCFYIENGKAVEKQIAEIKTEK